MLPLLSKTCFVEYHPLEDVELPTYLQRPPQMPTVAWNPWTDIRRRDDMSLLNISFPFGPMPVNITRRIVQNYDSAITYIDDLIGKLLAKIDEDTVIVIVGDHGSI